MMPIRRGKRMAKITQDLGRYMFRLYLSWVLAAIGGIGVVVLFVSLLLDLGGLYEAMQDTLLLLLPVTRYQFGKAKGSFLPRPR